MITSIHYFLRMTTLITCVIAGAVVTNVASAEDKPETVIVTYQAKSGQEEALIKVLKKHWQVAQQLNLVHVSPHVLLQGDSGDKRFIVEVFTWRDAGIPDNAPNAISELWRDMNELVEASDGKPGIEFTTVNVLAQ